MRWPWRLRAVGSAPRAVDDEGEVLDLLVQRRRHKAAAVKLMRKLLKKQGFAPHVLVTDKLRSYGAAKSEMGLSARHEQGLRKNNRAENRISRFDDASARCSASNRPDQHNASSLFTPPSTTPSTSSAISPPAARSAPSETKRSRLGEPSPRPEPEPGLPNCARPNSVLVTAPSGVLSLQPNEPEGIVTPRRTCGPSGHPVASGMEKISYAGYRFPPEIIDHAMALPPVHPQPA